MDFSSLLSGIYDFFKVLLNPVYIAFSLLGSLIVFIASAFADPGGAINKIICGAIDLIALIFPSTPDNLKISNILTGLSDKVPPFGLLVIHSLFNVLLVVAGLALVIKIYKLIPFKAT